MPPLPNILFCENPLDGKTVEPDFVQEWLAAGLTGFELLLFNFDELVSADNGDHSIRKIKPANSLQPMIYRGWMLTPPQYTILYDALLTKNYRLINTPEEYRNCHYLPDSLKYIRDHTPATVYVKAEGDNYIDRLVEQVAVFGRSPVIIKDYVKSEKHHWHTACLVPDAADAVRLQHTIDNFIALRGSYLNEGIVVREFVQLRSLAIHSKSGMPLTEEYRLFFLNKRLLGIYDYWEEGEYASALPDTQLFEQIAQKVENNFFSMDIATRTDGRPLIIEMGDAQVSGLPDRVDVNEFYERLKTGWG